MGVFDTMATTMVHVACRSRAGAGCSLSVSTPRRLGLARDRRASLIRRKAGSENEDGSTRSEEDIELMEARLGIGRKGREAKAQPQAAQRKAEPEQSVGPNSSVKWEEGSVFPEGWRERLSLLAELALLQARFCHDWWLDYFQVYRPC